MATPFDQALVRRAGNGWRRLAGLPLCDVCGEQDSCTLRPALINLAIVKKAKVAVQECGAYMPVIGFQDPKGLDGTFNTFRRGKGWSNRVMVGRRVGLFDLSASQLIGYATVEGAHVGVLSDLIRDKGQHNHMMKEVASGDVPDALQRVLYRAYGKTYAAPEQTFCVVEMRRE